MWYTVQQLNSIPAFEGLPASDLAQIAQDAGSLYSQVTVRPGIADRDLRAWAETAGITPDRYNLAARALTESGKALQIAPGISAPGLQSLPPVISAERLTVSELQGIARRLKVKAPKSATKAELAEAIGRGGDGE